MKRFAFVTILLLVINNSYCQKTIFENSLRQEGLLYEFYARHICVVTEMDGLSSAEKSLNEQI